jgi:CRP/FNR family transcriptional regulator
MESGSDFILKVLKELKIFSDLDIDALKHLSQLFEEKVYKNGAIIFEEGSVGNSMMVIALGKVRVSQKPNPETEEALKVLKTGDVFGEMALLEDLPRSATIIAHSDVVILEIKREKFLNFLDQDNKNGLKIVLKLAQILSSRLREADLKLKTFVDLTQWI